MGIIFGLVATSEQDRHDFAELVCFSGCAEGEHFVKMAVALRFQRDSHRADLAQGGHGSCGIGCGRSKIMEGCLPQTHDFGLKGIESAKMRFLQRQHLGGLSFVHADFLCEPAMGRAARPIMRAT